MTRWAVSAITLVVAVGATLSGCGQTSTQTTTSGEANPPVETGQTTFICAHDATANLLQWSNDKGVLSGTFTQSRVSGSAPNETVSSENGPLTGSLNGSAITVSVNVVAQPLSGIVTGSTLTLNVPQADGSLQPATCQAASLQQWNQLVAQLRSQADTANQTALQQQAQASTDAANARAEQDAEDALAAVKKFSLTADLDRLANDVKQTNTDLAVEKKAAAIGPNAPGETDCYNLTGNVNYTASVTVEYDATVTFSYDLQTLAGDITSGRTAISNLQRAVSTLQTATLPLPAGVGAATTAAQSTIATATATANDDVDKINAAVDTAYGVANAAATGDCASQAIGAAPAHLQHIST